ncbi:lactoylglutathione lyase [Actinidia rufa]|uniref:Lactoylglutathione lyase n=1 Tax=Actinidia rufa TaxID=165716 RepID=A0A7J0EMZ8_9ERIC|nr:lactoylglutathione lyase [Actinidia rufa]
MEIIEEVSSYGALPLLSLNHVSILVKSVWTSVRFYEDVLGFFSIKRPSSFNFHGACHHTCIKLSSTNELAHIYDFCRLFNYGIGIHLLENLSLDEYDIMNEPRPINPKDNHISFQCTDVELVKRRLDELGMKYVTAVVKEGGIEVDQVFFHDPDGYMIEICNCDNLPVLPISSSCCLKPKYNIGNCKKVEANKCGLMESVMLESLNKDMMNFSF